MSIIKKKGLITQVGGGGSGTSDHATLSNRALADQHPTSAITGLDAALTGKAATAHTHTIANVTGLQTALDGKQATITVSTTAPASPVVNQLWLDIT